MPAQKGFNKEKLKIFLQSDMDHQLLRENAAPNLHISITCNASINQKSQLKTSKLQTKISPRLHKEQHTRSITKIVKSEDIDTAN